MRGDSDENEDDEEDGKDVHLLFRSIKRIYALQTKDNKQSSNQHNKIKN
jgi:hypothetical protein